MKSLFTLPLLLLTGLSARAQLLPVPGTRNPDWALVRTSPPQAGAASDSLRHPPSPMPNAAADAPAATDGMPNAARRSIVGIGNTRRYWDADRRLRYQWQVRPGHEAPDSTVSVQDVRSSVTYTYRRRPAAAPPKPRRRVELIRPEPHK